MEESIILQEYLVERSPVDSIVVWNLALRYRYADRLEEAEQMYRRSQGLSESRSSIDYNIGETLLLMGRFEEALDVAGVSHICRNTSTVSRFV